MPSHGIEIDWIEILEDIRECYVLRYSLTDDGKIRIESEEKQKKKLGFFDD